MPAVPFWTPDALAWAILDMAARLGHFVGFTYEKADGTISERVCNAAWLTRYERTGSGGFKQTASYKRDVHGLHTTVDVDAYRAAEGNVARAIRSFKVRRIRAIRYGGQTFTLDREDN